MEIFNNSLEQQINLNPDDINYICLGESTRINLKLGVDIFIVKSGVVYLTEQNTKKILAYGIKETIYFLELNKT